MNREASGYAIGKEVPSPDATKTELAAGIEKIDTRMNFDKAAEAGKVKSESTEQEKIAKEKALQET